MESKQFSEALSEAINGEHDAMEAILSRYMPLISRQSVINGALDEDLRQYILLRVVAQIPKFDPERKK